MKSDTVTLYVPAEKMPFFIHRVAKNVIDGILKLFRPAIKGKTIKFLSADGSTEINDSELSMCLSRMVFPNKNLSIKAFNILFGDIRNFNLYLQDCATPEMHRLIMEVYDNFYVSSYRAKDITGENVLKDEDRYYYYYDYNRNPYYDLFYITVGNGPRRDFGDRRTIYLGLPEYVRYILDRGHGKEGTEITTVDTVDDNLTIFSVESEAVIALQNADNLGKNKLIDLRKVKFTQAEIKKLSKMIPVNEFFPETSAKEYAHLRLQWLLAYLVNSRLILYKKSEKIIQPVFAQLRMAWEKQPLSTELFLPLSFINLKGLRKNYIYDSGIVKQYLRIVDLLPQLKGGKWSDVKSIVDRLHSGRDATSRNTVFWSESFDKMDIVNKATDNEVYIDDSYRQLGIPLICSIFFGLAAIGAVDIAYSAAKDSESPYTGLKYVRLTSFGAYLIGLHPSYNPPVVDTSNAPGFQLDETSLTIFSEEGNNLETLMNQFATQIGPQRFAMSGRSFLKDCCRPEDVTARINEFKRIVARELPPLWNDFFESLKAKSTAVKKERISNYSLYRIPSDDRELLHLLSTDNEIRQCVIKAENYLILVPAEKDNDLKHLLQQHGYLLT